MLSFLETYAFGFTIPTGKLERKTMRKTETLRNLSIPQWSLTHRLPGLGQGPQLLLVLKSIAPCKRLRAGTVPPRGVEISILALMDNTLRLEYPWTAVLEEPK